MLDSQYEVKTSESVIWGTNQDLIVLLMNYVSWYYQLLSLPAVTSTSSSGLVGIIWWQMAAAAALKLVRTHGAAGAAGAAQFTAPQGIMGAGLGLELVQLPLGDGARSAVSTEHPSGLCGWTGSHWFEVTAFERTKQEIDEGWFEMQKVLLMIIIIISAAVFISDSRNWYSSTYYW